jgi:hypothetical protein
VTNLLNFVGQAFIISGFILFVLGVPLYYFYPPLYTGIEEHAHNLICISVLASLWAFGGVYPLMMSICKNEIKIGDLVKWDRTISIGSNLKQDALGVVVDISEDAPIGWYNDEWERETSSRYKVFWQDIQSCGWCWEEDISLCEVGSRDGQRG